MYVRSDRARVPVIESCDTVVAGGSLAGISVALALAQAGKRVALIEPRTYLGREITATQRPWLKSQSLGSSPPKIITQCMDLPGTVLRNDEFALHLAQLKTFLEDQILELGITLMYASYPVGIECDSSSIQGIVIANKSGRQAIACEMAVDATETALLARLADLSVETDSPPSVYRRTIEFDGIGDFPETILHVPAELDLVDHSVAVHRGCLSSGHVYVEYGVQLPSRVSSLRARESLETLMRQRGLALTQHLRDRVPQFDVYTKLGASSYESCGPMTNRLAEAPCLDAGYRESIPIMHADEVIGQAAMASFATAQPGLWCLSEAAILEDAAEVVFADPVGTSHLGAALGMRLADVNMLSERSFTRRQKVDDSRDTVEELEIAEQEVPQRGRSYSALDVEPMYAPVIGQSDVLTVGGGSSGAVAAITAAKEGLKSTVVDMNPGLGGTGTYGGINTYWFARRIGFVDHLMGWLDDMHDRLSLPRPQGVMATWNVEARILALGEKADEVGVASVLNALSFGAIVSGSSVRGIVAATGYGPVALLARVTLDATGDGDVAAWAGADTVYGSEREHAVMWGYMPQIAGPGRPLNVKTSMVDTTNIMDYVRMILAERRRGQNHSYDHGIYLGPRESRHVIGDVVMTLTDQLVRRCWPDVAFIAFSNYDMKGESTSDWVRMGIQPPNLEIEIPYRALLPNNVENILVVGKAFSATHDALAAPRMQPDLENLGGVAATAASMAIEAGHSLRKLDVRALQERLVRVGALPAYVLTRELLPLDFTDQELMDMIAELDADRPLHDYSNQKVGEPFRGRIPEIDLMCSGPRVIPLLESALETAKGPKKVLLAKMLGILGSPKSVPALVSAVEEHLADGVLPGRTHQVRHIGLPPDQGADPEAAHLLYALAMTRNQASLPLWQRVVEMLQSATKDEIFDRYRDLYAYATVVCYGAERLGDPRAVPILLRLHEHPLFRQQVTASGVQSDFLEERQACIELMIGRALARSGSPQGYIVLINYLHDVRASLAEHAHEELITLSGEDYGKDMSAWSNWLEMEADDLEPQPLNLPVEPVAAWTETILVQPGESS